MESVLRWSAVCFINGFSSKVKAEEKLSGEVKSEKIKAHFVLKVKRYKTRPWPTEMLEKKQDGHMSASSSYWLMNSTFLNAWP